VKADDDVAFGCHILLECVVVAFRLTCFGCKPNILIGMGDDSILDVVTSGEALPWSSIYVMFGSTGVDDRPLIFEVIFGNHC
jgi:hypothetical protein